MVAGNDMKVEAPEAGGGKGSWALELHITDLQGHKRPLLSQGVLRGSGRTQDIWWLLGLCLPGVSFHMVDVGI